MIQILALYLDFEGAKNIYVLCVLIWSFGGRWRFLTGVWHLDLDLAMVTSLWYIPVPNSGSLSWFWRCKEHPCPLSPDLEFWWGQEVPDWGFAPWSSFDYGHWSLIYLYAKFWLSILILKVQITSMSFKAWFRALENTGESWLGIEILVLIWIWSLAFGTTMFQMFSLYLDFEGANNIHVL